MNTLAGSIGGSRRLRTRSSISTRCGAVEQSSAKGRSARRVGFTAGGGTDVTARLVAQKLFEQMGHPVVVENRPGAARSIANERVAGSAADGYTLFMIANSAAVQVALRPKLPYDLERDFAPVSLLTVAPFLFVVQPSRRESG